MQRNEVTVTRIILLMSASFIVGILIGSQFSAGLATIANGGRKTAMNISNADLLEPFKGYVNWISL